MKRLQTLLKEAQAFGVMFVFTSPAGRGLWRACAEATIQVNSWPEWMLGEYEAHQNTLPGLLLMESQDSYRMPLWDHELGIR